MLSRRSSKAAASSSQNTDFPEVPIHIPVIPQLNSNNGTEVNNTETSRTQQPSATPTPPRIMNPFGGSLSEKDMQTLTLLHKKQNPEAPETEVAPPAPAGAGAGEAPPQLAQGDLELLCAVQSQDEDKDFSRATSEADDAAFARRLQEEEEAAAAARASAQSWEREQQAAKDAHFARRLDQQQQQRPLPPPPPGPPGPPPGPPPPGPPPPPGLPPPPPPAAPGVGAPAAPTGPNQVPGQPYQPRPDQGARGGVTSRVRASITSRLRRTGSAEGGGGGGGGGGAGAVVLSVLDHVRGLLVGDGGGGGGGGAHGGGGAAPLVRPGRVLRPFQVDTVKGAGATNSNGQRPSWQAIVYQGQTNKLQLVGVYDSRDEAVAAAEAYSPPLWEQKRGGLGCGNCGAKFALLRPEKHCRNCGRVVCRECARAHWPPRMLPATYLGDGAGEKKKARVCRGCQGAMEDFRAALRRGDAPGVRAAYATGVVNLRTPYTVHGGEYPVHCAAAGGSLPLLAWLVDERGAFVRDPQSKQRPLFASDGITSCMSLAAVNGNLEMMRWLTQHECSVRDIVNLEHFYAATEKLLALPSTGTAGPLNSEPVAAALVDDARPPPFNPQQSVVVASVGSTPISAPSFESITPSAGIEQQGATAVSGAGMEENECVICFENNINTVIVPCGHTAVCDGCSGKFTECPVCREPVQQVIKTFGV